MSEHHNIHDRANGRWLAILPQAGVDQKFLSGKHVPCPACGGKDRFRFSDHKGEGRFFCSGCGHGTGVDLVMRVNGIDFVSAVKLIEPLIQSAPVVIPKAGSGRPADGSGEWRRGVPIIEGDLVSRYLAKRGIALTEYPSQLRLRESVVYAHDDKRRERLPAMMANYVSPCRSWTTAHLTYLTHDADKAAVPNGKKFIPGKIPEGGAVRLAPSAETMGIAEGIETALSASLLFDIPVWAAVTAIGLSKWQPPDTAKNIIIFGDHDASFTGQHVAFALAQRLRTSKQYGLDVVEVRLPDDVGSDWNDVLVAMAE